MNAAFIANRPSASRQRHLWRNQSRAQQPENILRQPEGAAPLLDVLTTADSRSTENKSASFPPNVVTGVRQRWTVICHLLLPRDRNNERESACANLFAEAVDR